MAHHHQGFPMMCRDDSRMRDCEDYMNKIYLFLTPILFSLLFSLSSGCCGKAQQPEDRTLEQVLENDGPAVKKRLLPYLTRAGLTLPLSRVTILVFKHEKRLELWGEKNGKPVYLRSYKVLAASGNAGPKLKEGDRQVPEGIYRITCLNPNSDFHYAMLVDYPNDFDNRKANEGKRTDLGGDICIHGNAVSIGCVAVGDIAIEELFYLVGTTGMLSTKVIIAPYDFRAGKKPKIWYPAITWLPELYGMIRKELKEYPKPIPAGAVQKVNAAKPNGKR